MTLLHLRSRMFLAVPVIEQLKEEWSLWSSWYRFSRGDTRCSLHHKGRWQVSQTQKISKEGFWKCSRVSALDTLWQPQDSEIVAARRFSVSIAFSCKALICRCRACNSVGSEQIILDKSDVSRDIILDASVCLHAMITARRLAAVGPS